MSEYRNRRRRQASYDNANTDYSGQPDSYGYTGGEKQQSMTESVFPEVRMVSQRLSLVVFDGQERPRTYRLEQFGNKEIIVGRQGQGEQRHIDILLNSPFVSRNEHCRILRINGRWAIRDSGGMNGTMCNGKLMKGRYLAPGDMIRIGNRKAQTPEGESEDDLPGCQPWMDESKCTTEPADTGGQRGY